MNEDRDRVIIVGGGVVGLCCAYYLLKRGRAVVLFDQTDMTDSASRGNAGMIAPGHPPLPRPGLLSRTLSLLFDRTSPLYIPLRPDPSLVGWLWRFARACSRRQFEHSMRVLAALGHATREAFESLVVDEQLACEFQPAGLLDICLTKRGLERVVDDAKLIESHGFSAEVLDGATLRQRDPVYRDEVLGGVLFADSAFASPGRFTAELTDRVQRLGAEVCAESRIVRIDTNTSSVRVHTEHNEQYDGASLVLAAGSWTTRLARSIGVRVPMQPGKGYHVNIDAPQPCLKIAGVLSESFVAVTPMNGGVRLAGTVELSGMNHRMVQSRLDMLYEAPKQYLHGFDEPRTRSTWCGLRPCTADGLPVIGTAPDHPNILIATGHAMMGFALAPVTGRLISEIVLDDRPSIDIASLSPARFQ